MKFGSLFLKHHVFQNLPKGLIIYIKIQINSSNNVALQVKWNEQNLQMMIPI
jgi:hypothetical protein